MRNRKSEGGKSGAIKRLRLEEGWNNDKRRKFLTKNNGSSTQWSAMGTVLKTVE